MTQLANTIATVPNPIDHPELYDFITLAGQRSPGLAEVAGASNPRKLDQQDGHGATGATIKYNGEGLAQFDVKLTLWEPAHFEEWASFKQVLDAPKKPNPKALEIRHPALEDLNIRAVLVEDRTQLTQSGDSEWTVTIKFKQYRTVKPAGGVASGSTDLQKNPETWTKDPRDELDTKIDKLTDQLGKLAGEVT